MPDDLNPTTQQSSTDEVDVSKIPDTLPVEDVKGLKSTLEKLKAELKETKTKASVLEQLQQSIGNLDPAQIPVKMQELLDAQRKREELETMLAQQEAKLEAKFRTTYEQQVQEAMQKAETFKTAKIALEKRVAAEEAFVQAGGDRSRFKDFYALNESRMEYDPENGKFTRFTVEGKPVFDESGNAVDAIGFMKNRRSSGELDSYCFANTNKSTGAGLTTSYTMSATGTRVYPRSQYNQVLKDFPEATKMIREGKIRFTDG